jgi:hypothetical protein
VRLSRSAPAAFALGALITMGPWVSAQEPPPAASAASPAEPTATAGPRSPTLIAVGIGLLAAAALTPVAWMIAGTQADVLHEAKSEIIGSAIGAALCVTAGVPLIIIGAEPGPLPARTSRSDAPRERTPADTSLQARATMTLRWKL